MKRLIFLTIPLVVLTTLLTTVLAWETERTPDWEITLNRYLIESRGPREPFPLELTTQLEAFGCDLGLSS